MYIGGPGSYEIAYNVFRHIPGGNGIQIHTSNSPVSDVSIHHNLIVDIGKHGLNMADGTTTNIVIWDNVIADTDYAGLRINDDATRGIKLYNNTFSNIGRISNPASGAVLVNDTNDGTVDIRNNIFVAHTGGNYFGGCCNADFTNAGTFSTNVWFGAGAAPSLDTAAIEHDPMFVNAGAGDYHLAATSPAVNVGTISTAAVVTDDFDLVPRPVGNGFDVGAFER